MTWQYSQSTGRLTQNGQPIAMGYSGAGVGKNNPGAEQQRNVGPIPRGAYTIGIPGDHPEKGPITMRLTPVGHNARGRNGFLIHGDSIKNPGNASQGCIILNRAIRNRISASGDRALEVIQ